jgi:hypothetical protein
MADKNIVEYRRCVDCETEKPATPEYFHRDRTRLRTVCKECAKKQSRARKPSGLSKEELEFSNFAGRRYIELLEQGYGNYQRRQHERVY